MASSSERHGLADDGIILCNHDALLGDDLADREGLLTPVVLSVDGQCADPHGRLRLRQDIPP